MDRMDGGILTLSKYSREGLAGAIGITAVIGSLLAIPLISILIAVHTFYPSAIWMNWVQSPWLLALAILLFFPVSLIIEGLAEVVVDKVLLPPRRDLTVLIIEFLLWLGILYMTIQPFMAALISTILYTIVSLILLKIIPSK